MTVSTSAIAVMATMLLGLVTPAAGENIPALSVLPAAVAAFNPNLVARRATLIQERTTLHSKIDSLNAQCGAVEKGTGAEASCRKNQAPLLSALDYHIQQSKDYNAAVQAAIQNRAVPNLADDPNAARLSAAQLRLVDGRITLLQKEIALLSESNPEWAIERERLLDDRHEDFKDLSWEGVNLLSLGFARWLDLTTASSMDAARVDALSQAFKEPMASLPAEEARVSRIMTASQDPKLKGAIQDYLNAIYRYREARDTRDVAAMFARAQDSIETLQAEYEVLKSKPLRSAVANDLYASSAMVGRIAMIFTEEETAAVVAAGSAGASVLVGGRELVNLWAERSQLMALDQSASDRNRMKVELNGRLDNLQQQHDRLVWAVQHAGPVVNPR